MDDRTNGGGTSPLEYATPVARPLRSRFGTWLVAVGWIIAVAIPGAVLGRAAGPCFAVYTSQAVLAWTPNTPPPPGAATPAARIASVAFIQSVLNGPGQPSVGLTTAEVASHLLVRPVRNTSVLSVEYDDPDPQRANLITSTLARAATRQIPDLMLLETGSPAVLLHRPATTLFGLTLGATVGGILAWFRRARRRTRW